MSSIKIFRIAGAVLLTIALMPGRALLARAEQPAQDDQQQAQDLKKVKDAAERHRADLMKIPHVTGVVAETNDENEAAMLVEIDDPENTDDVTRNLPSQIEGFPVQVDVAVGDDKDSDTDADTDTDSDDKSADDDSDDDDVKPVKSTRVLAGGGIVAHGRGAASGSSAAKH